MNDQIGVKAHGCWWARRKVSLEDYWYNARRRWYSIDGGISRRFQRRNSDSIFEPQGFSSPSFDISFIPTLSNDHTFLRLVPLFPTLKVRNLTKHCSFETSPPRILFQLSAAGWRHIYTCNMFRLHTMVFHLSARPAKANWCLTLSHLKYPTDRCVRKPLDTNYTRKGALSPTVNRRNSID